jgi:hypothetical protein
VATQGIEGMLVETHNWGQTIAFWKALGYELEFETDHHSGQLRAAQGPWIFVAEVPETKEPEMLLYLHVPNAEAFEAVSPVEVNQPFEPTHWDTLLTTTRDPDGRTWGLQAPVR